MFVNMKICTCHTNHPKDRPEEVKATKMMLSGREEEDRQTMVFSQSTGSGVAMGLQRKHGDVIGRQATKNLGRNNVPHHKSTTTRTILGNCNDAEGVRNHVFALGGHCVMILRGTKVVTNEIALKMNILVEHVMTQQSDNSAIDINDEEGIHTWVNTTEIKVKPTVMICLAWMNDHQLKLARAFHLTFSIDVSHGICKIDNLAIMTITTKDAFGKTYVILGMWIPNQKTWMFHYVPLDLIPSNFCGEWDSVSRSFFVLDW